MLDGALFAHGGLAGIELTDMTLVDGSSLGLHAGRARRGAVSRSTTAARDAARPVPIAKRPGCARRAPGRAAAPPGADGGGAGK